MAAVVSGTHDLVQLLTRNLSSWRTDVSGDAVFLDGLGTKSIPDPTTAGASAGVWTPGRRRSPVTLLRPPLVLGGTTTAFSRRGGTGLRRCRNVPVPSSGAMSETRRARPTIRCLVEDLGGRAARPNDGPRRPG